MNLRPAAALTALSLAACTPALIPGTDVVGTLENRAVYGVIQAYAVAMQQKDAAGVLALVAPDYFDGAGTVTPEDDLDRAGLERALVADFARVDSLKMEIGVRRIEVNGERALVNIYFDGYFRVLTPNGAVPKRSSDLHQIQLRKLGSDWKITSGI